MKTMFAVMGNTDTTEGRGRYFVICLTENRQLALDIVRSDEYADRYGIMGFPGEEHNVREFRVVHGLDEFLK